MRFLTFFFMIIVAFSASAETKKSSKKKPYVPHYASIVIDAHTGKVLYDEKPDVVTYPASLTKMMTLYLLFEAIEAGKIKPNQKLNVSQHASKQAPSKLYLKKGDTITARNAMFALMTKSANDVAVVVAEAIGGTEENFAKKMTQKARQLGMKSTTFKNASGLPHAQQKTTARDISKLSQALYKHFPGYYKFFSTKHFSFRGQKYKNHNNLLNVVEGVDGIKTGYINASGWNLSASAARAGRRVIAVVLGGKSRHWRDKRVAELLEKGFELMPKMPQQRTLLPDAKPVHFIPDRKPTLNAEPIFTAKVNTPDIHHWAVQVGAYRSAKRAHDVALDVQKQVEELRTAKVVVNNISNSRKKLFRARLTNIEKELAQRICNKVVKTGHSCLPIKVE